MVVLSGCFNYLSKECLTISRLYRSLVTFKDIRQTLKQLKIL